MSRSCTCSLFIQQCTHARGHNQSVAALEVCVQLESEVEHPSHAHNPAFTPQGHYQLLLTLETQLVWQPLLSVRRHLEEV